MLLRYLAQTDETDVGIVALEYLKSLLGVGQVLLRPIASSITVETAGKWAPYTPLLQTAACTPYVNIVCGAPHLWSWVQRVQMSKYSPTGEFLSRDTADARIELYTEGVRNVLLVASPPPTVPAALQDALTTALRYQAFIVPTIDLARQWGRHDCRAQIFPVPIRDRSAFRTAVLRGTPDPLGGAET